MRGRSIAIAAIAVASAVSILGCPEPDRSAGTIRGTARSDARLAFSERTQANATRELASRTAGPMEASTPAPKRILFGDLHVHSTFSIDAFVYALPFFAGEGAHPPADACDFARHCSQVDFFSINDHAESLTPARWRETIESIRQCNERAGDPENPDLVAYVGWEWTQAGRTAEDHYGHRNVIFPGLADEELPTRPITSLPDDTMDRARALWLLRAAQQLRPLGLGEYADFLWLIDQMAQVPDCSRGASAGELPDDCRDNASTPGELMDKLEDWGLDTLVIPHGLAWGIHAPPGSSLDRSLARGNHRPELERLVEVYSGHGNSEEYRDFPESTNDGQSELVCPAPSADYLPCCWRAGEIMRARCGDLPDAECETRVTEARELAIRAGISPHLVFPDTRQEDWLDCDQCRNCFKPAYTLRPKQTAQYSLALSRFDSSGEPERFRWGFIGSTDNHASRPGTGYKQYERALMTDARGVASETSDSLSRWWIIGRQRDPQRAQAAPDEVRGLRGLLDVERTGSFMYPGGLVAVHAAARDRDSVWNALMRREVYGTSGPRILLWFDLLNAPAGPAPMGSESALAEAPRFRVRAAGSFVQRPGCPDESVRGLAADRLERLCRGECYHPGDTRHRIEAIEVVRVRPQQTPGEPIGELIHDPWRRFECPMDPAGCVVEFSDPAFPESGRDAVYYVRALQVETPAINGANLRTEFDETGRATRTSPCYGNYRTAPGEDCLAPVHERAWSSPIYLEYSGNSSGDRSNRQ